MRNVPPRKVSVFPQRVDAPGVASMASMEVYSVACIELLQRLWMELERVHVAERATRLHGGGFTSRLPAEMLRLELAVLLDACQSERWRRLLDISQRLSLMLTIREAFDALSLASEIVLQDVIAWVQNRLLDAILEHCAAHTHPIEVQAMQRAVS